MKDSLMDALGSISLVAVDPSTSISTSNISVTPSSPTVDYWDGSYLPSLRNSRPIGTTFAGD